MLTRSLSLQRGALLQRPAQRRPPPLPRRQHVHGRPSGSARLSCRATQEGDEAANEPSTSGSGSAQQQEQQKQQQQQEGEPSTLHIMEPGGGASDLGFRAFVSEAEWRKIDEKVNKYPCPRTFTVIGTGGSGFEDAMLRAVEGVVGAVHCECVSTRPSSGGKYVSVRIGPVWVESPDQVIGVFAKMREDSRTKWYM